MSFYSRTNLSCTNPEIIASGSTFNQMTNSKLLGYEGGEAHYVTRKNYMLDEIIELSKQYPNESFTAITWLDEYYYDRIMYTYEFCNGNYEVIKVEPEYVFMGPPINIVDDRLVKEFRQKISRYIDEFYAKKENLGPNIPPIHHNDTNADSFCSYLTFKWETEDHRFIGVNKHGFMIEISYESKDKENLERLRLENLSLKRQLKHLENCDGDEELPF